MQIKTLIYIEKESARGRNQRKYLSTTQRKKKKKTKSNNRKSNAISKRAGENNKERTTHKTHRKATNK